MRFCGLTEKLRRPSCRYCRVLAGLPTALPQMVTGRLMEEDPTLCYINNAETHQQVIGGLGEQHLDVVKAKLKNKFGVEIGLEAPRIAYRESIRKACQKQGRHKKQTGGHGQFGDVIINFEPCDSEQVVFEEKVFGGSVPKNFFPAVEKGLQYAYAHRQLKKRTFRSLWIMRINAAVRAQGMTYSQFIGKLNAKGIALNRKVMADLAMNEPKAFEAIVKAVK